MPRLGRPQPLGAGIVLAGGRAKRLDGIDKPQLTVNGRTLLHHAVSALAEAGADPVVIVARDQRVPYIDQLTVLATLEDPPYSGPVAALEAAVAKLEPRIEHDPRTLVGVFAADLPQAAGLARTLSHHIAEHPLQEDEDAAIVVDADGREQWLAGFYRFTALVRVLKERRQALGTLTGASLRSIAAEMNLRRVPDIGDHAADIDTWQDVQRFRASPSPEEN